MIVIVKYLVNRMKVIAKTSNYTEIETIKKYGGNL